VAFSAGGGGVVNPTDCKRPCHRSHIDEDHPQL
jgi:hypothetical protein